jgi:hypothetical protein
MRWRFAFRGPKHGSRDEAEAEFRELLESLPIEVRYFVASNTIIEEAGGSAYAAIAGIPADVFGGADKLPPPKTMPREWHVQD